MKVFIADDSELIRERLTEILMGLKKPVDIVGQAGTVRDAIERITLLHPDLVILDIKMPDGSGIEVLRDIKRKFSDIHILMFSQYAIPVFKHRCQFFGADDFFEKGDFDSLLGAVAILGESYA